MLGELDAGLLYAGQSDEYILLKVELLDHSIDLLEGELLSDTLDELVVRGDIEEVTTVFEVVDIDIGPCFAGALVAFVEGILHRDEELFLSTVKLCRCEAELLDADDLGD